MGPVKGERKRASGRERKRETDRQRRERDEEGERKGDERILLFLKRKDRSGDIKG